MCNVSFTDEPGLGVVGRGQVQGWDALDSGARLESLGWSKKHKAEVYLTIRASGVGLHT